MGKYTDLARKFNAAEPQMEKGAILRYRYTSVKINTMHKERKEYPSPSSVDTFSPFDAQLRPATLMTLTAKSQVVPQDEEVWIAPPPGFPTGGRYTKFIRQILELQPGEAIENISPSVKDTAGDVSNNTVGDGTDKTDLGADDLAQRRTERASKLGLIARFSHEFGFISAHDPTTGEWHDLPTKDAPAWAKREAFKRKELRKHHGITRLLAASEMKELWEKEQPAMWEHPAMTEKGIVYEDIRGKLSSNS